ncbi:copper chaperone PCu(A)C [Pseudophaeobacter flagellatus]|uniref:copper chaperone PCu(A)C n=1 Tax=Pseudophaeobacter flagellatus TaxID=2899119 RepID=UPI001E578DD9|nr:copper chaperone PCu(A)C [Pseudophaeobacter flagellatus]MCD9149484.1 copper chaperone PCu(A)C [Pseudophaeobacter flagellatus]
MSLKSVLFAAVAAVSLAGAASAEGTKIMVQDQYARVSTKMASSGAAFMNIMNMSSEADQLLAVRSDVAKRVELHTHMESGDGVMKMMHVEDGFAIPAEGSHMLQRGGDHVMFMGLTETLEHGDVVPLTLVFKNAGEINIEIPVDLERKPGHMKHSN